MVSPPNKAGVISVTRQEQRVARNVAAAMRAEDGGEYHWAADEMEIAARHGGPDYKRCIAAARRMRERALRLQYCSASEMGTAAFSTALRQNAPKWSSTRNACLAYEPRRMTSWG